MDIKSYNKIREKDYLLKIYMNDIKDKSKPLSPEEEKTLLERYYKADDITEDEKIQIRKKIVMANQRFLYDMACCYAGKNNTLLLELINVGTIGLYETFDNFDFDKGIKFMTYAQYYVRRAINYFLKDEILMIKKTNSSKLSPKIEKIQEEFRRVNGRNADIFELEDLIFEKYGIEISDRSDLYKTKIEKIEDPSFVDDDTFIFENNKKFTEYAFGENDYEVQAQKEGVAYEMNKIISKLPQREATIIKMAYGIGDYLKPYTNNEIAEALNLTPERVRQIIKASESKLKEFYCKTFAKK